LEVFFRQAQAKLTYSLLACVELIACSVLRSRSRRCRKAKAGGQNEHHNDLNVSKHDLSLPQAMFTLFTLPPAIEGNKGTFITQNSISIGALLYTEDRDRFDVIKNCLKPLKVEYV
jgi:hypothetical protein